MSLSRAPIKDLIGEQTRAEIFALVLTAGPLSRTGLAQRLGLSPSTVTRLLPPLLEGDYLRETESGAGTRSSRPGRPQRMLRVNAERHVVIGVKIAPTHVSAVLTDMAANVLARAEESLEDRRPHTATAAAAALTARLLADVPAGGPADRVLGIGVGVSGHVDSVSGVCRYSALLDWQKADVAGPLSEATGLPVVVNNDVNTLVVAERWFGQGRDVDSFAVVTVGSGIGCGLLLDGSLYAGASGLAGELGHLPLDPAGPLCSCGRRGCLEALASRDAVLRSVREALPPQAGGCPDIEHAIELARHGSGNGRAVARSAFAGAGAALGRGLAGLCNILNLQKIILAGEGVAAHDLFGPAMVTALEEHAFSDAARDCTVEIDPVNDDLWARGAACLVIRATVRAPLS